MTDELKPGDRVQTKIGTIGTIQQPPFPMPLHHLVKFDGGSTMWVLRRILERSTKPVSTTKKRCQK
jgi:preprotein translocase subunit YajC